MQEHWFKSSNCVSSSCHTIVENVGDPNSKQSYTFVSITLSIKTQVDRRPQILLSEKEGIGKKYFSTQQGLVEYKQAQ